MLVKLYRDSFETPWGFRLQGGKDLNQPLVLQRVFSNSPAEGELQRGDIILSINGRDSGSFTHKQAQDIIKFAGGQIEINVQRPSPGSVHIPPLQPTSPTRAPSNFVGRRTSDTTHNNMPPPPIAGHKPRKVTLNKFGGGTTSFGQSFKKTTTTNNWQPVSGPGSSQGMMGRVQDSLDSALSPTSPPQGSYYQQQPQFQQQPQYQQQQQQQQQYRPPQQQQYQPPTQQQYQPPPQQQYRPPPQQQYQPPPQQQYQPPPQQQYQQAPQQQYQPPPQQYQQEQEEPYTPTFQTVGDLQPDYVRAEDPVPEEEYEFSSVRDRKQQFVDKPDRAPAGHIRHNGDADDDYPHCAVWERRKLFMPKELRRQKKKFTQSVAQGYEAFGTDYSKPRPQQQEQTRFPRPAPPTQVPINRPPPQPEVDEGPKPWTGTLRSESTGGIKPWEVEDQEYIMPSQLEAMKQQQRSSRPQTRQPQQQRQPPAVSPKPKGTSQQIKVQVAKPQQSAPAPARQISIRTSSTVSKPQQQQQYQQQQQQKDGDRDWNQSYVYKMVKEEKKRETKTYPGQAPVTTQTYSSKTYQTGQPTVDQTYGISDF
ncbi:putative mediator of RNA polymerase II transcription subunit 26 isoform X4 [Mytilus trossulus]|uniref:putative mediator of RNA polymerase II transcription subunit 26 isoform X4 n=1 Tax=Mytilus trossulus TaxID=6551 RepID=UPI00300520ED